MRPTNAMGIWRLCVALGTLWWNVAACSTTLRTEPAPPFFFNSHVNLPYVEALEIPDQVVAGQPFQVVLRLSAQQNPEVLTWMDPGGIFLLANRYEELLAAPSAWPSPDYDLIRPWVKPSETPGPLVTELRLNLLAEEPGQRTLRVQTAATPEQGGLEGMYWLNLAVSGEYELSAGTVYRDYSYTVLPAEGGS